MRFRGDNPVYKNYGDSYGLEGSSDYAASYGGVFRKTLLLLMLTGFVAYYIGTLPTIDFSIGTLIFGMIVSPIVAYIMVILAHRNVAMSFIYTILYAIFEGIFLGLLTMIVVMYTEGPVVLYALSGTFGTVFVMLLVYTSGIVTVGERFKGFLFTAFGTLFLLVIVYIILSITGVVTLEGSLTFYMTILVFSIFVSTMYLLYDFDRVREMVGNGVDKQYEWSLSLGLIVVIVWLYVDILRLLAIIMRRD